MDERQYDEELTRQLMDWLSRGMDLNGNFPEPESPAELTLTEEDCTFLREQHIAVS